jgi:TonB family protein
MAIFHSTTTSILSGIKRAIFLPEEGASRPTFRKATYPGRLPGVAVTGRADVHLRLTIGKDGLPHDIQATFKAIAHPELFKEAVQIVAAWRFHPGEKDGQPVAVTAEFDLVLNGGDPVIRMRGGSVQ